MSVKPPDGGKDEIGLNIKLKNIILCSFFYLNRFFTPIGFFRRKLVSKSMLINNLKENTYSLSTTNIYSLLLFYSSVYIFKFIYASFIAINLFCFNYN